MADAPKILGTDTLRNAYPKLNSAIDNANEALSTANTANSKSDSAVTTANNASAKSDNTQTQLDTLVINNGQSDAEVLQARVKADNTTFPLLKDRLNDIDSSLAQNTKEQKRTSAPYKYDGAIFTFCDDDGQSAFMTKMKPIFDGKGIKATIGVVSSFVSTTNYLTLAQLKSLQDEGYDIVSHSKTHDANIFKAAQVDLSTVPDSSIETEFRDSQQWLKDNGFKGYEHLIYPWGNFGSQAKRYKSIARKYYKYAMDAFGNHNDTPVDNMYMKRYYLNASEDFTTILQPKIDECITKKGWMIFYTHSQENVVDVTYMNTVIDYIKSKNALILPFSEAIQYKGNVISAGEYTDTLGKFFLSYDGNQFNDSRFISEVYNSTVELTRLASAFKQGVTITPIASSKDTVTGLGGVLTTNIPTAADGTIAWDFCYQTFTPYNTNALYMRKWVNASSAWGSWEEISLRQTIAAVTTALATYALSSTLLNNVTKTRNVVTGTITIENATSNGNLAQFDTIASFNGSFAPSKSFFIPMIVIKGNGTVVYGLASVENVSGQAMVKSQSVFNTSDIRRIVVSLSYNV